MSQADDLLRTVTTEIIEPFLRELAAEAKQSISVKVLLGLAGEFAEQDCSTSTEPGTGVGGQGEVRVLVKPTTAGRFNFSAESIINGVSPGTGFSGFSLQGKCVDEGGKITARQTSHVIRYNVWAWSREFADA